MSAAAPVIKSVNVEITQGMNVYLTTTVQMFDFKDGNPKFIMCLPAGTSVRIQLKKSMEAQAKGFKFYFVAWKKKTGYIPKSAVHDFVKASMFGATTGVTYGADKWMMDGKGNLVAFPIDTDGKARCESCGGKASRHKLYETKYLVSMLDELIALLKVEKQNGKFTYDGFMIGALATYQGSYVIGYSGVPPVDQVKIFESCALKLKEKPAITKPVKGVEYYYNPTKTRTYSFDMTTWSCAAPRMVQYAWYALEQAPYDMSEKWFGATKGSTAVMGHSMKSCDTCRKYLPQMLCGVADYLTTAQPE